MYDVCGLNIVLNNNNNNNNINGQTYFTHHYNLWLDKNDAKRSICKISRGLTAMITGSANQFGCTARRSTTHALIKLTDE